MRTTTLALLRVAGLVALLLPLQLAAADPTVKLIVHRARAAKLTEGDVRAIYLKQKRFWDDGRSIVPINRDAGSAARELFSTRIFAQDSRRLASYWNQRYFDAGEFPPATLASDEAVIRFVAGNEDAIGYVLDDPGDSVVVVLTLR